MRSLLWLIKLLAMLIWEALSWCKRKGVSRSQTVAFELREILPSSLDLAAIDGLLTPWLTEILWTCRLGIVRFGH